MSPIPIVALMVYGPLLFFLYGSTGHMNRAKPSICRTGRDIVELEDLRRIGLELGLGISIY
jgi:hypothetical protein